MNSLPYDPSDPFGDGLRDLVDTRSNVSSADIAGLEPEPWRDITPLVGTADFPPAAAIGELGEVASAVAASLEQPIDYAFMVGLATISGATFGNAVVEVRAGYREPLAIYSMPAMPSGTRKSEANRRINQPVMDWQRERLIDWKREGGQHRIDIAEHAVKSAKEKARASDDVDEAIAAVQSAELAVEQARNTKPRLLIAADDSTSEALTAFLANNGGSALISSAEGGIIGNLTGRYSQGQTANLDLVLKAHSHETFQSDRVGREGVLIERPHLGLCIGAQPHVLEEMRKSDAMRERGFMQRFLVVLPEHQLGHRTGDGPPVPMTVMENWDRAIRAVLNYYAHQPEPRIIPFTEEAAAAFHHEWLRIEQELAPDGTLGANPGLQSWGAKLPGQLARIAGAFAIIENPRASNVGITHWRAAAALADYLTAHARKAWVIARMEPASRVLDWLHEHQPWQEYGTFTTRGVFDSIRGQQWVTDVIDVRMALTQLDEHGYIRSSAIADRVGRPSEVWEPHPELINGRNVP